MNKHHQTGKQRRGKSPRTQIYVTRAKERAKALTAAGMPEHLLDKATVMAIANVSFPTLWDWMRRGLFPRSRVVVGRSMWLASEINDWLASLQRRALKGDGAEEAENSEEAA